MARALLADPDIPKKWKAGKEETVVRCLYGNVCKALDENFRRVDCTLWPKKAGQAPESNDTEPPKWAENGPQIRAEYTHGRIFLKWAAATDNEAVYGYQVFRGETRGDLAPALSHVASVRGVSNRFEDARVLRGATYHYAVRPYDLAGNRGPMSEVISFRIP
jgi:hypothetical protein